MNDDNCENNSAADKLVAALQFTNASWGRGWGHGNELCAVKAATVSIHVGTHGVGAGGGGDVGGLAQ